MIKKIALVLWVAIFSVASQAELSPAGLVNAFSKKFPTLTEKNVKKQRIVAANGKSEFEPGGMIFPRNENDCLAILDYYVRLKSKHPQIKPMVVSAGGRNVKGHLSQGWSFDAQAHGENGSLVINTRDLSGLSQPIDWKNDLDERTHELKVFVYAGTTWRDTINLVNAAYVEVFHDQEHEFVPIVAPTGGQISIGGSLASNSHARASSVLGGYFADTVNAFMVATIKNGRVTLLPVSRSVNQELFHSLIGSFGRGGIVTSVEIKLQRVSKVKNVITKMKRVQNIEELTMEMATTSQRLIATQGDNYEAIPFLATGGIISSNFKDLFIFEADFKETTEKKPAFPLFVKPNCGTKLIYSVSRAFPRLAETLSSIYIDWHASSGFTDFLCDTDTAEEVAIFHNHPLDNYIFFQDSFAQMASNNHDGDYQTGHIAFMMELKNLPLAMRVIKHVSEKPEFAAVTFELQDVLPVPKTTVLMSPAYSNGEEPGAPMLVYTMSWAIDNDNAQASQSLKQAIEQALFETKVNGEPLAWLHPSKEYSHFGERPFYQARAERLEEILNSYGIEDRLFLSNHAQKSLYQP